MEVSMLTTIDNPFDPFDQFDEWYAFDVQKGYNCCEYVARLAYTSPELSALDQSQAVESAIDRIVALNLFGVYKKVKRKF